MNRYRSGGPTQATASTLCQKCLKRGHYIYECPASQQDRPYASRPSRTQQLANPKLAPKITEAKPKVEQAKSDPQQSPKSDSSSRKRKLDEPGSSSRKRSRSVSSSDSTPDSVSTISTNLSRTRSRSLPTRGTRGTTDRRGSLKPGAQNPDVPTRRQDDSRSYRQRSNSPDRKSSRRRSVSPRQSPFSDKENPGRSNVRPNTERKSRSRSPYRRGRGSDTSRPDTDARNPGNAKEKRARHRSLSPYSKRVALSKGI